MAKCSRTAALADPAALGDGGQRLFLAPGLDLAAVLTAGMYDQDGVARASGLLRIAGAVAP